MTHISKRYFILCLLIIVVVFVSFGCQPKPMRSSVSQQIEKQTGKKLRTTPTELRLKVHHAAIPLSGIIEGYADQIINDTPDPAIRANALLWKINGIPAVHRAAFQPDPFLSLLDLWVLSIQMRLFFEEGAGKTALGPWHTTAYDGSRRIESIVNTLAREASADGNISKGQALVADWCREHPIESLLFIRKSVTVVLASVVGRESLGTLEVVGELAVGMADLSVQMTAYAEYLPKQARWQTELLLENLAASDKAEKALSDFARLSRDVSRLTTLAEKLPDTATSERKAILRALVRDLDHALTSFDAQRIATISALQNERAVLSTNITAERLALLKEIERQRQETLEKIEAIGKRLLDSAFLESQQKIDHFFYRTLQVGGLLVAVVLIFWAGAIYYVNRRRRQN